MIELIIPAAVSAVITVLARLLAERITRWLLRMVT